MSAYMKCLIKCDNCGITADTVIRIVPDCDMTFCEPELPEGWVLKENFWNGSKNFCKNCMYCESAK